KNGKERDEDGEQRPPPHPVPLPDGERGRTAISFPLSPCGRGRGPARSAGKGRGDDAIEFEMGGHRASLAANPRPRHQTGTKLCTSESATRYQPSTSTKKMSLKGSEMVTGGSIIMPIDMRIEETTRSMMRNGRKRRKPISKARRSSLIMKAGTRTRNGISF